MVSLIELQYEAAALRVARPKTGLSAHDPIADVQRPATDLKRLLRSIIDK